jgi:hypothetical protein
LGYQRYLELDHNRRRSMDDSEKCVLCSRMLPFISAVFELIGLDSV